MTHTSFVSPPSDSPHAQHQISSRLFDALLFHSLLISYPLCSSLIFSSPLFPSLLLSSIISSSGGGAPGARRCLPCYAHLPHLALVVRGGATLLLDCIPNFMCGSACGDFGHGRIWQPHVFCGFCVWFCDRSDSPARFIHSLCNCFRAGVWCLCVVANGPVT